MLDTMCLNTFTLMHARLDRPHQLRADEVHLHSYPLIVNVDMSILLLSSVDCTCARLLAAQPNRRDWAKSEPCNLHCTLVDCVCRLNTYLQRLREISAGFWFLRKGKR